MKNTNNDYTPIRWEQRFQNFEKAYGRLDSAIIRFKLTPDDELNPHQTGTINS